MSTASNKPRVSIIIPCLNQGQFIEQAICSALDQGYENLELIVLDGGSEDDSVDILNMYSDDLAYWHSEWDSGPAEAVNAGLVRSTGEIVCVLAADDVLLPDVFVQLPGPHASGQGRLGGVAEEAGLS